MKERANSFTNFLLLKLYIYIYMDVKLLFNYGRSMSDYNHFDKVRWYHSDVKSVKSMRRKADSGASKLHEWLA